MTVVILLAVGVPVAIWTLSDALLVVFWAVSSATAQRLTAAGYFLSK